MYNTFYCELPCKNIVLAKNTRYVKIYEIKWPTLYPLRNSNLTKICTLIFLVVRLKHFLKFILEKMTDILKTQKTPKMVNLTL